MPPSHETSDSSRVSDSQRHPAPADTSHIIRQNTTEDIRATTARQETERRDSASNASLPQLQLCDDPPPRNVTAGLHSAPFDLNHDGSISRAELQQTYNNPAASRDTRITAFAVWDHFDKVTRLHDDWFNGNITEEDLATLRRSPESGEAARAINHEISVINQMGLNEAILLRRTFPVPEGP